MRLAASLPPQRLHPAVLAWADATPPRLTWVVAFSGGADSLALLLLLWAHWPDRRAKLTALHFNHHLRGAASNRDERFCNDVAASLGIRWRVGHWADADHEASEAQARAARHAFFGAELRRLRTGLLWLGHQQDDVAETMLMRLARGSGSAGLAAPRPIQTMPDGRVHLRPLLSLKKAEIAERLRSERIRWREDASNAVGKFLRNRMRRDVIPAWQSASGDRDALAGAALSRELLEEDDTALEMWLAQLDPITKKGELNLRRLAGQPRALVRRALHRWVAVNAGAILSRQAFAALLQDVMQGRVTRHSLGRDGFAKLGKHRLIFERSPRKLSN